MIRQVVEWPDKALMRRSDEVTPNDDLSIVQDLIDTMVDCQTLGISAPQLGVSKRICVINDKKLSEIDKRDSDSEFIVMINPKIVDGMGDLVFQEGCNSVPGHTATVQRAMMSVVKYRSQKGNWVEKCFSGMTSIVVQHEIDHLEGITIADRQSPHQRAVMAQNLDT